MYCILFTLTFHLVFLPRVPTMKLCHVLDITVHLCRQWRISFVSLFGRLYRTSIILALTFSYLHTTRFNVEIFVLVSPRFILRFSSATSHISPISKMLLLSASHNTGIGSVQVFLQRRRPLHH
ncbi:hypothetical protein BJ912DRAFT_971470, partial [Pholiota molesta]